MKPIRIATRSSPLALWQAEHVAGLIRQHHPDQAVELLPLTTTGDRLTSGPLMDSGGKGLFVKELERAMLDGEADMAVHSMKDVPAEQPEGLRLTCMLAADDPRDAWVSNDYDGPQGLPVGARVGTASLRRQSQVLALRPDLKVGTLRGNVQTRLGKLDAGDFDAIILAAAGLRRLGMTDRIRRALEPDEMLPSPGQGILGIELRAEDEALAALLAPLADNVSTIRNTAERSFAAALSGDCRTPLAAYAEIDGSRLLLTGLAASPDGKRILRDRIDGDVNQAAMLALTLAERMRAAGAREIMGMDDRAGQES